MARSLPLAGMVMLALLPAAGPAAAHKLRVFATVIGPRIEGRVYFVGGGAARGVPVTLRDSTDAIVGQALTTAPDGTFVLTLPFRDDFKVHADAQDGHAADFPIPARRLPAGLPASGHDPATSGPAVTSLPTPAAAPSAPDVAAPDVAAPDVAAPDVAAIEVAVARQVAPLAEMIDEMRAEVRLRDMLGGAGYVLGIFGLWALFARRRA